MKVMFTHVCANWRRALLYILSLQPTMPRLQGVLPCHHSSNPCLAPWLASPILHMKPTRTPSPVQVHIQETSCLTPPCVHVMGKGRQVSYMSGACCACMRAVHQPQHWAERVQHWPQQVHLTTSHTAQHRVLGRTELHPWAPAGLSCKPRHATKPASVKRLPC